MAFNNMATDLRNTFSKLKESEVKYRTLIENVDSMIYNISAQGIFLSMNKSFEKSVPYNKDELIGRHFNILVEEKGIFKESMKYFHKTIESKATQEFQTEYMSFNNQRKIMSVRLVPQFNTRGELVSVLGTNTDITDLILAQEHVQRLLMDEKNELERMVKERTTCITWKFSCRHSP
jgi:PAS domain S-box-containing protein